MSGCGLWRCLPRLPPQLRTLLAVALRNSLDFFAPQFLHLSNGDKRNFFMGRVMVRITWNDVYKVLNSTWYIENTPLSLIILEIISVQEKIKLF